MYLWVLLATFIVSILSYNLSIRPDADRALMEAKARAIVTKFRAHHNAYKLYIASKRLSASQVAEQGANAKINYYSGMGFHNGQIIGTNDDEYNNPDELKLIKGFLPHGFQADPDIYSKVFCFTTYSLPYYDYTTPCEDDEAHIHDPAARQICCAQRDMEVYVISWQVMPERWYNKLTLKPSADMISVITQAEGYGYNFGYVTESQVRNEQGNLTPLQAMSGGMYRTVTPISDEDGNTRYIEDTKYRPVYTILKTVDDSPYHNGHDFTDCINEEGQIVNPCLIAINKVQNREETGNDQE